MDRRTKRTWLLIAMLDLGILVVAGILRFDYLLITLAVVVVAHGVDVAFLLTK